jgi:hypothetical protein
MKVNAGLVIDFGNSETRAMVLANSKTIELTLSNRFAELTTGYAYPAKYHNDLSNAFIYKNIGIVNGQILEREFIDKQMRPSALQKKSDQYITELTLNLVLMRAMLELEKLYDVPLSQLEVKFKISVLLPPSEHDTHEEIFKDMVKQIKRVDMFVPKREILNFEITDVNVYPEGFAAFFGVLFKEKNGDLLEVPENAQFTSGYTLVLDIGAGTTDVVLIRDSELILSSRDSFAFGGNTVDSHVESLCRKEFGFSPQNVTNVVVTSTLVEGTVMHHVEHLVTEAKAHYAHTIKNCITRYLEKLGLPAREIKGFLIVGGGSVASVRDGVQVSPPMSQVMAKYLTELAPNTKIIDIGDVSPRKLNIIGLKYMHKYS